VLILKNDLKLQKICIYDIWYLDKLLKRVIV
jgi:hypothetical protein